MNFNIHNLLKFRVEGTNKNYLKYLSQDYYHFKTNDPIDPDIDIIVSDFAPDNKDCYVVNHKYFIKENYLFCEDSHKIVKWKVCLRNLTERKTTVYFSGSKFGEVFLRDYIIEPLIALKLAVKGFSLLHASGMAIDGNGFIFPACKGVGKTSTILNLIGKGTFLGNDKIILSRDSFVYSYPSLVHIFSYNLRDIPHALSYLTMRQRIEAKIKLAIKVLSFEYASLPLDVDPWNLWGESGESYPLQSLILLTKTNRDTINVVALHEKDELAKRLSIINRYEMQYFDGLMSAYSYIYPRSDIDTELYWQTSKINLSHILKNIACYEIEVPRRYTLDTYNHILELLKVESLK